MDLFTEVANATLATKVKDLGALTKSANTRGNPNEQNITRLFASIGYPDILDGLQWQNMTNKQLRAKLRSLNELRNKIVHGTTETVSKAVLSNFVTFISTFAAQLDRKLRGEVRSVTRSYPWAAV